jgi:hypothetical protein
MEIAGAAVSVDDVAWLEAEGALPGATRTTLSRQWCERRGLRDGRGRLREVAARIDLARHARAGRLRLPAVAPAFARRRCRRRPRAKAQRRPAPSLVTLETRLVSGRHDPQHEVWKRALDAHHYLGAGKLCGAQLRYLVYAGDEVVAVAGFSAAARHVRCRDRFIGWSALARRRNRSRVIAQSRLCVTVKGRNLASRVQAILLRRVAADWEAAYGVRPVLVESFVERARFTGASYRAANWTEVGATRGRGRQDGLHACAVPVKRVFVFPLERRFREILGIEPVHAPRAEGDWAQREFGAVELGDRRLTQRLVKYGRARGARMNKSTPACLASKAATKGAYRLLNHECASLEAFLRGHREETLARAAEQQVVLAIQDTTSLNYTAHPATEDLGPIGPNGADATLGLEMHSVLLATTAGTPLGVIDVNAWARDPRQFGQAAARADLPIAKKESGKWLRGYAAAAVAAERLGEKTRVVVVGDREADIYELFVAANKGRADLLVRAVESRRPLWEAVLAQPAQGALQVKIERSGSRKERVATLELRFAEVEIERPTRLPRSGTRVPSVKAWAIAATEVASTPAAAKSAARVEWLLLTTLPIADAAAAAEKVAWYARRWLIEVYHRTLKTGCLLERRQSKLAKTLKAALAIDVVVAWRVLLLVHLSREQPDLPCTVVLSKDEWEALVCLTQQRRTPPATPPTLKQAALTIAYLGGFLGSKNAGAETTWKGMERLTDLTIGYCHFRPPA